MAEISMYFLMNKIKNKNKIEKNMKISVVD